MKQITLRNRYSKNIIDNTIGKKKFGLNINVFPTIRDNYYEHGPLPRDMGEAHNRCDGVEEDNLCCVNGGSGTKLLGSEGYSRV